MEDSRYSRYQDSNTERGMYNGVLGFGRGVGWGEKTRPNWNGLPKTQYLPFTVKKSSHVVFEAEKEIPTMTSPLGIVDGKLKLQLSISSTKP